MNNLKSCPFCGGFITIDVRMHNIDAIETECHCYNCGMIFKYEQHFSLSGHTRVAITPSFEDLWNRRSDNG